MIPEPLSTILIIILCLAMINLLIAGFMLLNGKQRLGAALIAGSFVIALAIDVYLERVGAY